MTAPLMMGVSGCRGIVGESLTLEVALRFAGAFGGYLRDALAQAESERRRPLVVLGRDGRAGGHMIHHAVIAGLTAAGCDVVDLGVATTPTVGVMVDEREADGGMVVTASHNPQQWNGLKCLVTAKPGPYAVDACAPEPALAAEIVRRFHADPAPMVAWEQIGAAERDDRAAGFHVGRVLIHLEYLARGAPFFDNNRVSRTGGGKRVVLDSVNASGGAAGTALLDRLGCNRILHLDRGDEGVFPHAPEPLRENLAPLCRAVAEHGYDVGFAQDPDADRLAIVDERGEYIGEEYTLALAVKSVLGFEEYRNAPLKFSHVVCANLSTSRLIDDVAADYGARVVRTPVGEAHVVAAMKRERAVIGGEGNGGVIWPKVTFVRDSLSAMALVLALMARTNMKISELVARLPRYAIEKRKVELRRREDAAPAVEKIAAAYKGALVDLQDGVRIDWPDRRAWLHVRASNTEPIMRLIGEAPTTEAAQAILNDAERVIGA